MEKGSARIRHIRVLVPSAQLLLGHRTPLSARPSWKGTPTGSQMPLRAVPSRSGAVNLYLLPGPLLILIPFAISACDVAVVTVGPVRGQMVAINTDRMSMGLWLCQAT
jgi:hypothetical protein